MLGYQIIKKRSKANKRLNSPEPLVEDLFYQGIREAFKKKVLNFGHWPNLCDPPPSQTSDTLYERA